MADENAFAAAYLDEAQRAFRGYKRLAEGTFSQLQDDEFFYTPDGESNSMAILIKHMAGNLRSRWTDFLTMDGEKPDRNRDQEFVLDKDKKVSREELMRWWENGLKCATDSLAALKPEDLGRTVYIRGDAHTVLQAINRSLAHFAYHVGQMLYLGKHIRKGEWKSLSIPKGKSAEFNATPRENRKVQSPTRG